MKQCLKEPTVILFALVACGSLFFSQFAAYGVTTPLAEVTHTQIDILGEHASVGELKSSRILQGRTENAAIATLALVSDDENDEQEGAEDSKDDTEGPDRLWDSAMLG